MKENMEAYKAPKSDLTTNEKMPSKPVKAILFGLSVSIILTMIVSVIIGIGFGFLAGINFENENEFETMLTTNPAYMILDIIITASILYLAGTVVRKYAPEKELIFGTILTVLTLLIIAYMFYAFGSFTTYPLWYSVATLLIIPVSILYGSRPVQTNKN